MDLNLQRRLLYIAAAALLIGGGGAVVWAISDLPEWTSHAEGMVADSPRLPAVDRDAAGDRSDGVDFSLPLQRTLYDPPPPPPKPKPKPVAVKQPSPPPPRPPRLDWTLVGTIIDAERRVAILADASGKTDIRAAGETVELLPAGVSVRSVDSDTVILEHRGSTSTLRLKQAFQGAGAGSNENRPAARRRNR